MPPKSLPAPVQETPPVPCGTCGAVAWLAITGMAVHVPGAVEWLSLVWMCRPCLERGDYVFPERPPSPPVKLR